MKDQGNEIRSKELGDESKDSVRPDTSGGLPTIQINPAKDQVIKIRYFEASCHGCH